MFSYSEFKHEWTKSSYDYVEPLSEDYKVFVNGTEIPVYTCRISKYPFNRVWPGYQRSAGQTDLVSFVNIVSDEAVDIKIVPTFQPDRILIKPYSENVEHTFQNGEICFELKNNGQYVLATGDFHRCLYIFNSKPIEYEGDATYYFGPGVHMPGKIELHDNESVYVDKDALVFGCVFAENAENIRVYGNGVMDDRTEGRLCTHCYEPYTNGNLKFYDCKNVSVEGVLFKDSAIWCVNVFHCENVVLDNIKVFGQWRYNTDGVDIINSRDIVLRNSFIHSFDDTISIKGIDRYADTNNENILVENCVLWCDWGNCIEIGIETMCREYKNIVFRNCDIISGATTMMDINNGECAEISDVVFEDIRAEYNSFTRPGILQRTEEMEYPCPDLLHIPWLFRITNNRWRTPEMCEEWGIPEAAARLDLSGIKEASVHDVKFSGIKVYYDKEIPLEDGKCRIPAGFLSRIPEAVFYNIEVSDITVNGERVDTDYLELSIEGNVEYR